ncbi:GDP-mannose 4,6-dehydratase [Paenibacillus monticola]|uniref:NAD-dependent epimerase/dehydratase family protein n=1 Tax=Paenibacillus monticola TaxID=2666075 RepID=A0A7X2H6F6_9BACL|nr:GDP-mannose 4,6-dehydratase [Paenibacillus monticola]MRN54364.1 NAD-dependent epimerase/dehydratase family protein [Paenibacillus monticola]
MKALITGATGFVGQYLASYLINNGYEVWGTTRINSREINDIQAMEIVSVDFDDIAGTIEVLDKIQPDQIFHLAGQSSVRDSWTNKMETFQSNVNLTIQLLEAVMQSVVKEKVSILTIGSSEEYGGFDTSGTPISEETLLKPTSPYGISKATVGMLVRHYFTAYNLKIIHARPFNHIGPGQRLGFVVADFSNQIVEIERGHQENIISVGNLSAKRDFTDVRDIVRAYHLLLNQKENFAWGESVNVCSGIATSIQNILDSLLSLSHSSIDVVVDSEKLRPVDIPLFTGDNSKLKSLTGWHPAIGLTQTLNDVLKILRDQS